MSEQARGITAIILACVIWGLSPLFYVLLRGVPALDVLAHRTLWSCVAFGLVLAIQRRLSVLPAALRDGRNLRTIAAAALLISINWFVFIWAVQGGRAVDASLGYYTFPLVAVVLGALLFGDRLHPAQWGAFALACVAVALLTYGLGGAPWIALTLAVSFASYGALKKGLSLGPVVSVAAEVVLLTPLAVAFLVIWGTGAFLSTPETAALLILSGPVTAAPLILFAYASRRVSLSTIGLVQYLNPTLQFLCAVVLLGETFTDWHQVAFALIWSALAIYTLAAFRTAPRPTP